MQFVTVTALRDFVYDGIVIKTGAVFSMRPLDATIYRRKQFVSASRHPSLDRSSLMPDPPPEPAPPSPAPPRRRRRYRRRDLVADDAA